MPKTRLNAQMRDQLRQHARTLVRCPAESAAAQAAKKALTDVTDKLADARFPEREMSVLLKYELVQTCDQLDARREGSRNCEHLRLSKPFYMPRNGYQSSCHYAVELPNDHPVWALQRAYANACRAYQDAKKAKLEDYYALINSCRNYEDVEEVWPEAAAIKDALGVRTIHALTVLSEDTVARIKADVAARAERPAEPVLEPE